MAIAKTEIINRIDHLVLAVADIDKTVAFYSILGMNVVEFGQGRLALTFGNQKINLHKSDDEFEPKALMPTPGSGDLCFITDMPLIDVIEHLGNNGIRIIEGPVHRTGALGLMLSIYLRDPDGNLIEIANYENNGRTAP